MGCKVWLFVIYFLGVVVKVFLFQGIFLTLLNFYVAYILNYFPKYY